MSVTYTFTVSDQADQILREVGPSQGWDGVSDFSLFMQNMFNQYATGVCASAKSRTAATQAAEQAVADVQTAFSATTP